MSVPDEIRNLATGVIDSFESSIGAVGHLIEQGLQLIDGYQREQEAVCKNLCTTLASAGNLRRKDFEATIERIRGFQSKRESEIKSLIQLFLGKQKNLTGQLRRAIEAGILEEVRRIQEELQTTIEKARQNIQAFRGEQNQIRGTFANLNGHQGQLSARDFKQAICDLERQLFGLMREADSSKLSENNSNGARIGT